MQTEVSNAGRTPGGCGEYRRRNLPIDLIVIDFFHWPLQGEWKFDPTYWPDPGKCSVVEKVP